MSDDVRRARVQLEWPTVERGHTDEQPLYVLATVLGQLPRQNRLYRALVVERQQAVQSSAMNRPNELAGSFAVSITAPPGRTLDELVQIADREIERLKKEGPTEDEVVKAQNADESRQIFSLQSATRLADFLNGNNVEFGDPKAYVTLMKKLFAVTPDDVKRVANTYLTANRIRLDVNPGEPTPRAPETPVARKGQESTESVPVAEIKDTFDRSKMPQVTGNPPFTPPPVVRRKLSNGLEVLIAERHQLPILALRLEFRGGDNLAPKGKEGLGELTAPLLTEGTASRDSLTLAGELSEIGATMGAASALEETSLSISTLTRHEAKALDLFVDVLTHPSFPAKEMERVRRQRLAFLASRRDNATQIAGLVFPKLLYGAGHPYGCIETVASIRGITRDDVVQQYKKIFVPNNAALIVVGDTKPDVIVAKLEEALHDWKAGEAPEIKYPEPPASPKNMTVYLVNRPAAAQSVLSVGQVGVPRMTPDYFALLVLNGALGGQFSSRINLNLREDKGYTYGARSSFAFRQGPGPFQAGGSVQTAVTKEALSELVKELKDITGSRPLTDDELAFAKDRLIKGFPSRFETTTGHAGALSELVQFRLPDDYFTTYQSKLQGITRDDVARAAQKYLDPDRMTILVVGDRKVIEPKLKELPYASTIHLLDPEGNPATKAEPARPAAALFTED
jgi:zinc protease